MKTRHPILLTCLSEAWGGLEMVAYEFAYELNMRDIPFLFICYEKTPLSEKLKQLDIFIMEIKPEASTLKQGMFLSKIINDYEIETVIIQKFAEIKPLLFSKLFKKNLNIFAFSHMWVDHFKKDIIHRFIYKNFSKVIALTHLQKLNLLDHVPLLETQISVVPNWVSSLRLNGVSKKQVPFKFTKKNNKPLLTGIIASRLDPQKGQDLAIEALERLQKEGLFFNLLIMGDNTRNEQDFRAHLLELIHQKGLEDYVILIPFSESILDYIAGSDFLLMPSWQETFGRVIPEAMTLGVTCIASDKGGVPDLIFDGKNGFLFKSRDLSDLTRVLKEIINDPSALKKVALQGLKDSKQFKSEKILNELLKIFKIDPSPTHRPTHRLHRDHQIEASNPTLF